MPCLPGTLHSVPEIAHLALVVWIKPTETDIKTRIFIMYKWCFSDAWKLGWLLLYMEWTEPIRLNWCNHEADYDPRQVQSKVSGHNYTPISPCMWNTPTLPTSEPHSTRIKPVMNYVLSPRNTTNVAPVAPGGPINRHWYHVLYKLTWTKGKHPSPTDYKYPS